MKKILHITTHLGGGVGRALADLAIYEKENATKYEHEFILLERPKNTYFLNQMKATQTKVYLIGEIDVAYKLSCCDVVILHWWHHPVMAKFLSEFPKVNCRLILWSHVCGCTYPLYPSKLMYVPQFTLFTTPYSYDNPFFSEKDKEYIKENSLVVYGMGNLKYEKIKLVENRETFNIGYVGTLDFNKLNDKFADYAKIIIDNVGNVKFIMVGEKNEELVNELREKNILDKFVFTGYVDDVMEQYKQFDVFSYLLNPYHFGATENVLLEALGHGLPTIALNQATEKYIIANNKTGILVKDKQEYLDVVLKLKEDFLERKRLSNNAYNHIIEKYKFSDNIARLHLAIDTVLAKDKKVFDFNKVFGDTPDKWFMTCLGKDKKIFTYALNHDEDAVYKVRNCERILRGESKSSIKHFYNTYPNNYELKYLYELISEGES